MWNGACMAFGVGPLLTMGAIDALDAHGSDTLKRAYLEKLVTGEWMGTMHLTEPQAGSDVGALRTRAERTPDGTYRITGQKIFITYGEHDLTDNIIHFVLARLPDAPPGTRGISLFLVPKFLLNADGSPGTRNDVRAHSIEHKLGIHGSPTCTMVFGDKGGAVGFVIGEENAGMACMFTMMNRARLAVGLQGVGIAERATQQATAYARERKQGRTTGMSAKESAPIIAHPDVRRMLITMRALTQAARSICYATALALDRAERSNDKAERETAHARASLLTPLAKAFSTDIGIEVTSLGVHVHGGMGFIEETGAAQHYRDARITAIYEGTNGIQAIDLVTRKLGAQGGASVFALIDELSAIVKQVEVSNDPAFGSTGAKLRDALGALDRTSRWLLEHLASSPNEALAGATPYLRLFGATLGGCMLASEALAAKSGGITDAARYVSLARFFAENIAVQAGALERTVTESAESVAAADAVLLG
jgi:alkylation response protein AidB-like acyl-CoA dehydrogenase